MEEQMEFRKKDLELFSTFDIINDRMLFKLRKGDLTIDFNSDTDPRVLGIAFKVFAMALFSAARM